MSALVRRCLCWLVGHGQTVAVWEAWQSHPEYGTHRVIRSECSRCGAVLGVRSVVVRDP